MELSGRPLFDNPLDAELFVVRPELERLERNSREGVNTLVLGEPGAGKTSLLRHLLFRLRRHERPILWIDGAFADTVVDLLRLIEDDLRQGTRGPVDFSVAPSGPGETAGVLAALRSLRNYLGGDRLVVLLDLAPGAFDAHALFGRFRDELWQVPLTWIVAAPTTLRSALLTPPADVFFEDVIELGDLEPGQQEELIRRRLEHGDSIPGRLEGGGEGNPRRLLRLLRESRRTGEPVDAHFSARSARTRELEAIGHPARVAYEDLEENGPASASDEDFLDRLGWSRQRAAKVLSELEDADLVRSETRQSETGRPRKLFAIVPPAP